MIIRTIIIALCAVFAIVSPSYAQNDRREDKLMKAMLVHCLAPIVTRTNVADLAAQSGFTEFSKEQADLFSKGKGRVFAIPGVPGDAVLVAIHEPGSICGIHIRHADADNFWKLADIYFGENTPFKKIDEVSRPDNGIGKNYEADFKGPVLLMLSMKSQPVDGGLQGLMTVSRVKK